MRRSYALTVLTAATLFSSVASANPIVIDLVPGTSSHPVGRIIAGPTDAFLTTSDNLGNARLYRSNGTSAGTALLDTYGPSASNAANVALYGATSKGLFFVYQGALQLHNAGSGAVSLGAVPSSSGGFIGELANGIALFGFSKNAGVTTLPLFKSDGTPAGTGTIAGADYDGLKADPVATLGNAAFFVAPLGNVGRTDGSSVTTFYTAQGAPTKYARGVASCNGKLFIVLGNGQGEGVYVSDGTSAQTLLHEATSFSASWFRCAGTKTFFLGYEPATGVEIWVSDGTVPGTHITKDINGATTNSFSGNLVDGMYSTTQDRIYFRANDGVHGDEPWTSDGSAAGTVMLSDVAPGATSSFCAWVTPRGQGTKAFCNASGKIYEADGTTLADRSAAFTNISAPTNTITTAALGTKVLYKGGASQPATGSELAVIDGTQPFAGDGGVVIPTGDAGKSDAAVSGDAGVGGDSGSSSSDGGDPAIGDDGGVTGSDSGSGSNSAESTDGSTGCTVARAGDTGGAGLAGIGLIGIAAALASRRRRS
jgi:ELWxxDGT repeat protein